MNKKKPNNVDEMDRLKQRIDAYKELIDKTKTEHMAASSIKEDMQAFKLKFGEMEQNMAHVEHAVSQLREDIYEVMKNITQPQHQEVLDKINKLMELQQEVSIKNLNQASLPSQESPPEEQPKKAVPSQTNFRQIQNMMKTSNNITSQDFSGGTMPSSRSFPKAGDSSRTHHSQYPNMPQKNSGSMPFRNQLNSSIHNQSPYSSHHSKQQNFELNQFNKQKFNQSPIQKKHQIDRRKPQPKKENETRMNNPESDENETERPAKSATSMFLSFFQKKNRRVRRRT
ncbi:hypothetical protein [Halobacillus massiliensis]|uniref:hypothetical protein n=1 Tax=Halobacillus massiliensis TaxID=1926286 RepID=UPI0009E6383B|nr:hypothetical protein [Halobacillus massiliensis]